MDRTGQEDRAGLGSMGQGRCVRHTTFPEEVMVEMRQGAASHAQGQGRGGQAMWEEEACGGERRGDRGWNAVVRRGAHA